MYLNGSESVSYTPVAAYSVSPMAEGITSGGSGDGVTIVQNTRFLWVYDPDSPETSGFTGTGNWCCGVPNTPLANITEEQLLQEFDNGTRTNLNAEFQVWQQLVDSQVPGETDYVRDFISSIGNISCVTFNAG